MFYARHATSIMALLESLTLVCKHSFCRLVHTPGLLHHSDPLSLSLSLASSIPRESKELADFARIHPSSCATNGLNSNLMVTGGPALAGSGRWSADPASHLAAHPWLPRTGSPSMWLAGHPYGECPGREQCPEAVHTHGIQGKVLLQPSEAVW